MPKKLENEAREKVFANFSVDIVIKKLENLYIKLLVKKLGRREAKKRGIK